MKDQFDSLVDFAKEIERIEQSKEDFLVPTKEIRMIEDESFAFGGNMKTTNGLHLTDYAHGQVASKLGIPKNYYDKMLAVPGLRTINVNEWLRNKNERNMVRTLDGNVRAFLSDRFRPLDNYAILNNAIFPAIQPLKDTLQVKARSISDTKMYIQFIVTNLQAEIEVGDIVNYGMTISNSEVGAGSLNVEGFVYRLVCSNGMVRNSLFKKYHVGRRIEEDENYHIWSNDTLQKELEGYQLRMRDVIKHTLTAVHFEKEVKKMKDAANDKIEDVGQTIENVTKRFDLTEKDGKSIIQNMVESGSSNRWGLANGITALAHDIENPDRQYQYEKIGSQIIDVSPSDWKIINAAA